MLDLKFIRENLWLIKKNNQDRQVKLDLDRLLDLDKKHRELTHEVEEVRALRNKKSKRKPAEEEIEQMRKMGDRIQENEKVLEEIGKELRGLWYKVPNLTHPQAPRGGEENYQVLYKNRDPDKFAFSPKNHEELMSGLDLVDFERGAKVAASKFYFFKNEMVRLNLALINYGLDVVTKHGYEMMETPDIAKNEILEGIGFNPRGAETQVYSLENTDLSLIGTAEIAVGGYHAEEVLDLERGPKKYVALSHCFRTEAGSYGRASQGLYRVHQFTKLEMFVFCRPEDSEKLHQEILEIEKEICAGLEFPYRVIDIASGDLGGPAYRKFDIEAWMVMQGRGSKAQGGYGEITSTSNCTDYQSRALNIRYRKKDGSTEFVHTLNGTAVVTSRFPIAIFENNQQTDGSVRVPKVLQQYMGQEVLKIFNQK